MDWVRMLAYIAGTVDQELRLRNEYLATENRILRAQVRGRLLLSDAERKSHAEIAHQRGRRALQDVVHAAKPDTILAWYSKPVAREFDGFQSRRYPGRSRVDRETGALIVRMARENSGWGHDRIAGALANIGHIVSDQTIGYILRHNGIPPAPERKGTTTRKYFIRAHMAVLAGSDFFTVEAPTPRGLATYYLLFLIHLQSRSVEVVGFTPHPNEIWMTPVARNVTMDEWDFIDNCRYLKHNRDCKFLSRVSSDH